jgi:hypothetical protein
VDPRAGLDDMEKRKFLTLPGLELRLLGRPTRSQWLYRLSYPGSFREPIRRRSVPGEYEHFSSKTGTLQMCPKTRNSDFIDNNFDNA